MTQERKVRDVMTTDVRRIREEASLRAAARMMADFAINALIVMPTDVQEPYGILTSSDIVDAIAQGRDLDRTRVSDVCSTPLLLVTPGVRLRDAARLMMRHGLRHLAVFNGKEIVGIVANYDLVKAAAEVSEDVTHTVVPA